MKNSGKFPFNELEQLLLSIEEQKKRFVSSYKTIEPQSIINIDEQKGIITSQKDCYLENEAETITFRFEDKFKKLLALQILKSKRCIDLFIVENPENYLSYLVLQEKAIQYLIDKNIDAFSQFPILVDAMMDIESYINQKYLTNQNQTINLDFSSIPIGNPNFGNDGNAIFQTLNYLKGYNDKRQKIMPDNNYYRMIGYVEYFIKNGKTPEDFSQIDKIEVPNNLLRFTFCILHDYLYGKKPKNQDFVQFVKELVANFDNYEYCSFKRKFGNRDGIRFQGVKYIPEMIKSKLREGK